MFLLIFCIKVSQNGSLSRNNVLFCLQTEIEYTFDEKSFVNGGGK